MELLLLIVAIIIAAETTYLVVNATTRQPRRSKQKRIFVDTSVLIDGRILDIATAGFIPGILSIPRSVINELQLLADQSDHDKRTRARHGLDVASKIQAVAGIEVELYADSPTKAGVDARLLELAKRHNGTICTIDFNLIKVAHVESIDILNINDLARNLRMAYLPGEQASIELTQKGSDQHQAVGHLADGTMVVVEQASQHIGQTVLVEFIRSLQTAAGRMMFAKMIETKPAAKPRTQNRPSGQKPRQSSPLPSKRQANSVSKKRRVTNEDRLVELANK